MRNSLVHVLRVCFTSQISSRYIIYIIVMCTVLILLLEKTHLDNINNQQQQQQQNLYREQASNMADRELQEQIRQFYQTSNVDTTLHNITEQNRFTLILQTYNRTDILVRLLNHYSAVTRLDKIIVVWNNIDELPPFELWMKFAPHPVPVVFLRQEENKMRNRLKPFSEIETEAVLIIDDDLMASANDINFALSIWQQFPDFIVGFVPRKHILSTSGVYTYGSFELETEPAVMGRLPMYSMVLIGAAFVSTKYLRMFEEVPPEVHNMIDDTENCDDISFNVMVADHLRTRGTPQCPGIYVKPRDLRNLEKDAMSGYIGMWHHADHMLERSYCINKLSHIYNGLPLLYSNIQVSQFHPYHND